MQPHNFRFGGGLSDTVLHPGIAVAMLIAIVLILVLPREKVIAPFLLAFFNIPFGQVLVVGGVHFTMLQILILTVLGRMAAFRDSSTEKRFGGGFTALDKVVVIWSLSAFLTFSFEFMDMQAVVKGLGDLVVSLGGYLAARFLIPDRDTFRRAVKVLAVVCVIQGACMMSEQYTRRNVFGFAGAWDPAIREGHIRSEGAMGTLCAGPFAGVLIPLFIWLGLQKKSRLAAFAGIAGATAMAFASHASTSWMAYGAGLAGLCFWPLRRQMRLLRLGLVAMLVALHIVMKGPVWSLIEHIDLTGGSSSYHRYILVDNTIRHFWDWWLLGCQTYGSWGYDMWDLSNQFVVNALTGGLITLVLYIAIFKRSFRAIGNARKRVAGDRRQEWLLWSLGASLFANIVAHFGVNYGSYMLMCLFVLLCCISVATLAAKRPAALPKVVPSESGVPSVPVLAEA